jgi:tRNA A-37 threonylcarbamoyl transferase component Bud32
VDQIPPDTRLRNNTPATGAAPLPGGEPPATQITVDRPATAPPGDGPENPPIATPAGPPSFPAVPGYEILGELGHGGMGVVYKARQIKANRVVALKMILARAHATLEQKARFQIEAEAVAALQHPNIVQLYEVGEFDGLPFFSLEFVEGGSLAKKFKGLPRSPKQSAQLVETLARAMHTAHQAGVVHRDLKPANVLVGKGWVLKVTDFGLAKQLDAPGQTASGVIMGTLSYMAPEQAGGRSKHIGPAADIYALGAILYELLTGRPPFRAATQMDTLLQVLSEEPIPPSRLNPKLARDLETICLTCLRKDPARRYASAEALADDLRRLRTGEPIAARPVGRLERAVKWTRRNPALAGLLASLVLGTAVATFFAVRANENAAVGMIKAAEAEKQANRADAEARRATQKQTEAEKQTGRADTEAALAKQNAIKEKEAQTRAEKEKLRAENALWINQASRAWQQNRKNEIIYSLAISGDGRRIISAGEYRTVKVWDAATGQALRILRGHTRETYSVAISGDGRRIVSADEYGTVKVWDAATGQEKLTLRGHTSNVKSVAISADGRRIASGGGYGTIKVWDAATGQALRTLQGHTLGVYSVALSGDGRRIVSGGGDQTVKVWDAATGQALLTLQGHKHHVTSVAVSGDGRRIVSGSEYRTVKVWDAATGQALLTLRGHTRNVKSVAISNDGRWIVSGSDDHTVKVWDAATGQDKLTLRGHAGQVRSVAISCDGRWIVSAGGGDGIRFWEGATGQN